MTNPNPRHPPASGKTPQRPITIGWREYVSLPEWNIPLVKAKIDTGARSSAIDVSQIEEIDEEHVRFHVAIDREDPARHVIVEAPIARKTRVKSSFGAAHFRYLVETTIRLGTLEKTVEIGLVSRRSMLCRMLIGRKALEHDFVVDVSRRYMLGSRKAHLKAMNTQDSRKK